MKSPRIVLAFLRGEARWYILPAVFAVFALAHVPYLASPPSGFHNWRETDTAAMAENFLRESWNILQPRVDLRGAGSGVIGAEFPIYSFLTAIGYQALGFSHTIPRVLSLLGILLGLAACFSFLHTLTGSRRLALFAVLGAACSPLVFFYAGRIQPDPLGWGFALTGLWSFQRWRLGRNWGFAILGVVTLALAGVMKPTFLCIGAPMAFLLIQERSVRRAVVDPGAWLFALATLAPLFVWFPYAQILHAGALRKDLHLNIDLGVVLHELGRWEFYRNVFGTWLWEMVVGWPLVPAFIVGIRSSASYPWRNILYAWFGGCVLMAMASAPQLATPHDYYLLGLVPPAAIATAIGLENLLASSRRWLRVATMVLIISTPLYTIGRIWHRFGTPAPFAFERPFVAAAIPKDELVIAYDWSPSIVLYRSGRKGWVINNLDDLQHLPAEIQNAAHYLVLDEQYATDPRVVRAAHGPVRHGGELAVVRLRQGH